MLELLTAAEMRAADEMTICAGTPSRELMERAAKAALNVLEDTFDTTHTLILCGSGNNGGDGLAMARFLAESGKRVSVFYLGKRNAAGMPDITAMSAECARQYGLLPAAVAVQSALQTNSVTAVVDAVFGIGLCRPVTGEIAACLQAVAATDIPVLALDIPSGIHSDNGSIMGTALPAKVTVAIAAAKWGHYLYPGTRFCGETVTVDIGIKAKEAQGRLVQKSDISALPNRPQRSHKGTFGRVLIIGGSYAMSGAGYLAAKAAYRTGAGLVEILSHKENRIIYQAQLPEALLTLYDPDNFDEDAVLSALQRASAVAVGMGMGQSEITKRIVSLALMHAQVPLILDADALNVIAADPFLRELLCRRSHPTVLTPHMGEMSRLTGTPMPTLAADLPTAARALAKECGAVVVLKDARTVISNGTLCRLNTYGNSGMATGGSGDVLAGVIASLAAQGVSHFDAATLGVLTHALAGDAAKAVHGEHGLMASDIADAIGCILP